MTTRDERIIAEAYERHIAEWHMTDFTMCQDAGCKAARWIEESAKCYHEAEEAQHD